MKLFLQAVVGFIAIFALLFILELFGLGMFKFFEPKREAVRREVFENTKSYVHGKIQDLAKYYDEYRRKTDVTEREAI